MISILYAKEEYHEFPLKFFLFRSTQKLRRGTLLCCVPENFRLRKILWIREGMEGISQFSVENFLSHCTGKFRSGTLQCFTNSGYRKMLRINHKNIWQDRDSNPEPTAWESCCPNLTAVIYFWMKKVGNFALKKIKKRKNDPTECE